MELLLVRHAIAFERDARRWPDDDERPLSPEGLARAGKAAAGMKQLVRRPGRLLVSPLVRARQTAAILTEVAGWPRATECADLAPGATPEALLAAVKRLTEERIAAVGHEPFPQDGRGAPNLRGDGARRRCAPRVAGAGKAAARRALAAPRGLPQWAPEDGPAPPPPPPRGGLASQTSPIRAMKMIPET